MCVCVFVYSVYIYICVCVCTSIYIYMCVYFQKPVVPTTYTFLPQVNARVFLKCAVHLGSPVLFPHAATASLSIRNWLRELVSEKCGISRLRCQTLDVSCRWEI